MLTSRQAAPLLVIALSVIGVVGDYFLKRASAESAPLRTWWFAIGFVVYSSTTFGWVAAMRHLTLASIGVLYGTATVLCLVLAGVLAGERLRPIEAIGVVLAVGALMLLRRFV
jgi:small multidrug resistance pump